MNSMTSIPVNPHIFPPKTPAAGNGSSLALLAAARSCRPLRITPPTIPPAMLRTNRQYLRALRAAEMKAWTASGGDVLHAASAS